MFSYFWGTSTKSEEQQTEETSTLESEKPPTPEPKEIPTPEPEKNSETNFNIRQFSLDKMRQRGFVALVHGRRGSGKTTLNKDLMQKLNLDSGMIVNPTNEYSGDYVETEKLKVTGEITPEVLKDFVSKQQMACRTGDKEVKTLILDDCCNDTPQLFKNRDIKVLYMNGRFIRSNLIITQQHPTSLPANIRHNTCYFFIFKETCQSNRRKLYNYYGGVFPTFKMFNRALDRCTANYGCMVIDNTSLSNNLEDHVFYYKADYKC